MASIAAGTATASVETAKKKARLNPARRKSAKTKLAASPEARIAEDESQREKLSGKPTRKITTAKDSSVTQPGNKPAVKPLQPGSNSGVGSTVKPSSSARPRPSDAEGAENGQPQAVAVATPAMVTGGLIGCAAGAAVILGAGLWKNMAGVDSAILSARSAKLCMDNLIEEVITNLKAGTYSAPEAIDMVRRTTLAYASTIPGGATFVERLFREVEMVRKQRGKEVDQVLAEAYTELGKAGQRRATTAEMHTLVFKQLANLSRFASNATQDVLARNPKFRPYMTNAVKTLHPPPEKVPTVKVNMAIKHKLPRVATA